MINQCKKIVSERYPIFLIVNKETLTLIDLLIENNFKKEIQEGFCVKKETKIELGDFIAKDSDGFVVFSKDLLCKSDLSQNEFYDYQYSTEEYEIIENYKEIETYSFLNITKDQEQILNALFPFKKFEKSDIVVFTDWGTEIIDDKTFATDFELVEDTETKAIDELGICLEENCNDPAKKDYTGLKHYVCEYHYKKLCEKEQYR